MVRKFKFSVISLYHNKNTSKQLQLYICIKKKNLKVLYGDENALKVP